MLVRLAIAAIGLALIASTARADDPPAPYDTQEGSPPSPAEALRSIALPPGFKATLFAAEPDVRQPIGLATDARGRLWVAENDTYAEVDRNFDNNLRDGIVILEDADGDGRHDRRTRFWGSARRLTSVELGDGGVWALDLPRLVFIPDRDGDDRPDGEPEVHLDGFDADEIRHNFANGLRWGPDGWLYGRHGITTPSLVGKPGTPDEARTYVGPGVWRYQPITKAFEMVATGTTNPWGMDWDDRGQLFFINTVIGHLWHVVPGAHYERMFGADPDPNTYALMPQTADHYHWDRAEMWSDIRNTGVTPTTDQAGGGHAHSGMLIYQGTNWPADWRGKVLTLNFHGRRVNVDRIERNGAAFVGRHEPDMAKFGDPWFRGVELVAGADGGVFVADWSDSGECHENDGIHRSSGRIYKITYGDPAPPAVADLATLDDTALAASQAHPNEWQVRQARRILQGRAAAGRDLSGAQALLRALLANGHDAGRRLRGLWALYVTGGIDESGLVVMLGDRDEAVRGWAVRLLVDRGAPSVAAIDALEAAAKAEPSGLVKLELASALRRLPADRRWAIAGSIAADPSLADDPFLGPMVWYAVADATAGDPARASDLAMATRLPIVRRLTARRLAEALADGPGKLDPIASALHGPIDDAARLDLLRGMAEGLRGWRRAPRPEGWDGAASAIAKVESDEPRTLAAELSAVFGDGRALAEVARLAADAKAPIDARRQAVRALVDSRAEGLGELLRSLLAERELAAEAARGLAVTGDKAAPAALLGAFRSFYPPARREAVTALASRPAWAAILLDAVADGRVARNQVPAFLVRQIRGFGDPQLARRIDATWPELVPVGAAARDKIAALRDRLTPESLAKADLARGRALYDQSCASCHVLFGRGGKVGPDITGSQRQSLDYLLENMIAPSATVAADYRVTTLVLADGRILDGIVVAPGGAGKTITLQTPTDLLVIDREEVEEQRTSDRSLMPEGQLDTLAPDQVRDLIAYLMSPVQVEPPAGTTATETDERP